MTPPSLGWFLTFFVPERNGEEVERGTVCDDYIDLKKNNPAEGASARFLHVESHTPGRSCRVRHHKSPTRHLARSPLKSNSAQFPALTPELSSSTRNQLPVQDLLDLTRAARMAALTRNLGCLAGALAISAAVAASFSRLATAGGVSAFFIVCHISLRGLDAILHANCLFFSV